MSQPLTGSAQAGLAADEPPPSSRSARPSRPGGVLFQLGTEADSIYVDRAGPHQADAADPGRRPRARTCWSRSGRPARPWDGRRSSRRIASR